MDKKSIYAQILEQLENNLDTLQCAVEATYERSTHAETKAENKYDTFGLEASYLAHGQSVRVQEIEHALMVYKAFNLTTFDEDTPIGLSALVTLEAEDGEQSKVWLGSEAGGMKVEYKSEEVTIVTPQSPLGKKLMGKYQHDAFELNIQNKSVEYEIVSVV
ncbi:MAG: hypothetical protein V3U78_05005 [Thiotrichaceae bacterium]